MMESHILAKETHIIVADDSLNIRRIVLDGLGRLGFKNITAVENGAECFDKLQFFSNSPTPIQLIVSDLNMPVLNGMDLLKKIRTTEQFKDIPFVLVTTESEKSSVIHAAIHGVSAYVVKPFHLETMSKRLQEAWKKHHINS